MEVSFTNANPRSTGESFVLKFNNSATESTKCILVDSGADVDVESLLDGDDSLAGIFLTHVHSDHYRTLPANTSDVPVFTSPDTARLLPAVLKANTDPLDIDGDIQNVLDHVRPVGDEWVQVIPHVDIRVVPAGHTPGACGFILRIDDGEVHHILITGDFTRRPVAGNAGLSLGYPVDIDAVFFNSAVDERGTEPLTKSLDEILESVLGGGATLVAADGLVSIQYAHLIAGIGEKRNHNITVTLAGQAASLYDQLDRDHDAITTVPRFESSNKVLTQNDVCIAGPSTLSSGSSHRLFTKARDNPSARVIAIGNNVGETGDPPNINRYPYVGHPSRERAEEVIKSLYPKETVIEHGNFDRYASVFDFCYTWACDVSTNYTFYENGVWHPPDWVGEFTRRSVESYHYGNRTCEINVDSSELNTKTWPSIEATATTPKEEGVDMEEITGGIKRKNTDSTRSTAKYSTENSKQKCDTTDAGDEPLTAVATTDGGAAQVRSNSELHPHTSHPACVEQAERERLVEVTEEFLDQVRPSEDESRECDSVRATVLEAESGELLLQINRDNIDINLDHQQTVTASICTD